MAGVVRDRQLWWSNENGDTNGGQGGGGEGAEVLCLARVECESPRGQRALRVGGLRPRGHMLKPDPHKGPPEGFDDLSHLVHSVARADGPEDFKQP